MNLQRKPQLFHHVQKRIWFRTRPFLFLSTALRGFTISSLLYLDKVAKGKKSYIKDILYRVIFYHILAKCFKSAAKRFVQWLQKLQSIRSYKNMSQ